MMFMPEHGSMLQNQLEGTESYLQGWGRAAFPEMYCGKKTIEREKVCQVSLFPVWDKALPGGEMIPKLCDSSAQEHTSMKTVLCTQTKGQV